MINAFVKTQQNKRKKRCTILFYFILFYFILFYFIIIEYTLDNLMNSEMNRFIFIMSGYNILISKHV